LGQLSFEGPLEVTGLLHRSWRDRHKVSKLHIQNLSQAAEGVSENPLSALFNVRDRSARDWWVQTSPECFLGEFSLAAMIFDAASESFIEGPIV
jgi:hypothetical protein